MERDKNKNTIIKLLIIIVLILAVFLIRQCNAPQKTAIIVGGDEQVQEAVNGQIRIKMNPSINIKKGTMQDMEFCNYNKDRLMQVKITVGEKQIYESGFVNPGDILKADIIETKNLKKGVNQAVAEIYTYNLEEEPIGQTNVKIQLNL